MNSISLSKKNPLPTSIEINGKQYACNPDFRAILRIFRLLDDPEVEERHKYCKIVEWFYPEETPPIVEGVRAFFDFIRVIEQKHDPDAAAIDYEFDADVIFASFWHQYGINLLETSMHWYVFTALMHGLAEDTALCERLRLRKLDTSHLKGKAKHSAEIAKQNAQPRKAVSDQERDRQEKLMDALRSGKDPNEFLGR